MQKPDLLLVEDNAEILSIYIDLANQLNLTPHPTVSGDEAWKIYHSRLKGPRPIRFVLTDLDLPVQSGLWLAKKIRQVDFSIPIVLATGYVGLSPSDQSYFSKILTKPFDMQTLKSIFLEYFFC